MSSSEGSGKGGSKTSQLLQVTTGSSLEDIGLRVVLLQPCALYVALPEVPSPPGRPLAPHSQSLFL